MTFLPSGRKNAPRRLLRGDSGGRTLAAATPFPASYTPHRRWSRAPEAREPAMMAAASRFSLFFFGLNALAASRVYYVGAGHSSCGSPWRQIRCPGSGSALLGVDLHRDGLLRRGVADFCNGGPASRGHRQRFRPSLCLLLAEVRELYPACSLGDVHRPVAHCFASSYPHRHQHALLGRFETGAVASLRCGATGAAR